MADDDKRAGAGLPGEQAPEQPAAQPKSAGPQLRESLKAVAGETPVGMRKGEATPAQSGTADIAAKTDETTELVDRKDQSARYGIVQDALRVVEAALGTNVVETAKSGTSGATDGAAAPATSEAVGDSDVPPTVGVHKVTSTETPVKTQIVRGQRKPARTDFHQEPVVAWLVIIGGPGLGAFRPVFEGNNSIGRAASQRVSIDFGDDAISAEEQAFLRYDSTDREFLFVPNLAKTNVVSVNEIKPTSAVKLSPMDVITMGQTQLVFVPFCGEDFDWSELADLSG